MVSFFKRVAGAFVELEPGSGGEAKGETDGSLDEITRETSALLAQLEEASPTRASAPAFAPAAAAAPPFVSAPQGGSVLQLNAEAVFRAAQLVDGPNSSERILKLIGGLTMFPPEQQVVMLRAMDAADEAWSESGVLEDARARQSVLRRHLQAVQEELEGRTKRIVEEIAATRAEEAGILAEIDRQIADLQQKRQLALTGAANAVNELQQRQAALEVEAEKARRGITHVINALSQLITFFTGGRAGQTPPPQ